MKKFAKIHRPYRGYSRAHVPGVVNKYEVVAVCWYALDVKDVAWVDDDYRGGMCQSCAKIVKSKEKNRE